MANIIAALLIISIIELIIFATYESSTGRFAFSLLNPIANYKAWGNMNWFGVIFFTLLLNILCPVYSLLYWFGKLCTVGRK